MIIKHFNYLDSLRGLAALTVVFYHIMFSMQYPIYMSPLFNFILAGKTSVLLFFILSGFVLSYRFIGESNVQWKIIESIIKRPIRLVGVVLFATYLTLIQYWNIIGHPQGTLFLYQPFIHPFTFGQQYNGVLWTIDIELMGSLMTFIMLLAVNRFKKNIRIIMACFIYGKK